MKRKTGTTGRIDRLTQLGERQGQGFPRIDFEGLENKSSPRTIYPEHSGGRRSHSTWYRFVAHNPRC